VEDPLLETAAGEFGIDPATDSRTELRRLIRDAWPASDCSPWLHVVAGPAVTVILAVAHEERVDLIVVPGCHQTAFERLAVRSTTERLLRQADVSVLVAPASIGDAPRVPGGVAGGDVTLDAILGTSVQIVRGAKGSRVAALAYRALSTTVPMLLQIERVLE
jgi:hypothetical protein